MELVSLSNNSVIFLTNIILQERLRHSLRHRP